MIGRQAEEADLLQLQTGMEPGAVGAEEELAGAGAPDGLDQVVEAADSRGVGVDVGVAGEEIDGLLLRPPVVPEAAHVGDHEGHVRILRREHVEDVWLAGDVDQHGDAVGAGSLADLARRQGLGAVDLDPSEAVLPHRPRHQGADAAGVAPGVYEREADQALRMGGDDLRELGVGSPVIAVEAGEDDGAADPRRSRAPQVGAEGGVGEGRAGHGVTTAGVAVEVDDHG